MTPAVQVRVAEGGDREVIERLRAEASAQTEDPCHTSSLVDPSPSRLWIAEFDGVPCGYAAASFAGGAALLSELYCQPMFRRIGVGHALLGAVESTARSAGATSLCTLVFPGDRSAKNFFEAHAMPARRIIAGRTLTDE